MFDIATVRSQFPSLLGSGAIFFDNPGGTQIARLSIDRLNSYLLHSNANHGGAFSTSRESDQVLEEGHRAAADLLNARSPAEIVFGQNMTTLTFAISRSLARLFKAGDEVIVTRLDHDANIAPWLLLAEEKGLSVRWVDIRPEDVTLDMDSLRSQLNERTRLVACATASNAVGTVNDVATIVELAHSAGALCYVDAVHSVPHLLTDVQALDCDFLVCSAYKFFGPHLGILYGKLDLLERLPAYKVRPAAAHPPGKFETGTQNHEAIAGTVGAIEYLAGLAGTPTAQLSRRARLERGMQAIREYEMQLQTRLLVGLSEIRGAKVWGISDPGEPGRRVPTVSITMEGWHPRQLAERLAAKSIYTWDGNYYAVAVMERLGLESKGGMLRIGLVHYNTEAEIDFLLRCLGDLQAKEL